MIGRFRIDFFEKKNDNRLISEESESNVEVSS